MNRRLSQLLIIAGLIVVLAPRAVVVAQDSTGATSRVSVSSEGVESNHESTQPSISVDGRFVAFQSMASNLIAGDTNSVSDVFVHDRQTGVTDRVPVDSSGNEANGRP